MNLGNIPQNDQKLVYELYIALIDNNIPETKKQDFQNLFKKILKPGPYFNLLTIYQKFQYIELVNYPISMFELFDSYDKISLLNQLKQFLIEASQSYNKQYQLFFQLVQIFLIKNLTEYAITMHQTVTSALTKEKKPEIYSKLIEEMIKSHTQELEENIKQTYNAEQINKMIQVSEEFSTFLEKEKPKINESISNIRQINQQKINSLYEEINKLQDQIDEMKANQYNYQQVQHANLFHVVQPSTSITLNSWKLLFGKGFQFFNDGSGVIEPNTCIVSDFFIPIFRNKMIFSFKANPKKKIIFGLIYYDNMFREIRRCDLLEKAPPLKILSIKRDIYDERSKLKPRYHYTITLKLDKEGQQNIAKWRNREFLQKKHSLAFNYSKNIDLTNQIIFPNVHIFRVDEENSTIVFLPNAHQSIEMIHEDMYVSIHSSDTSSFVSACYAVPYDDQEFNGDPLDPDKDARVHGCYVDTISNDMTIRSKPEQAAYCSVFMMNIDRDIMDESLPDLTVLNPDYKIEMEYNEIPNQLLSSSLVYKLYREHGQEQENNAYFVSATFQFPFDSPAELNLEGNFENEEEEEEE